MKLKKMHWIGICFGAAVLVADVVFFMGQSLFLFLLGIALLVVVLPFLVSLVVESNVERERNEKFLEFTRNLAESVKTGTPVGKSIVNMSSKDFGSLSPNIRKLANQITLGIPISKALQTFAEDIDSVVVKRAVSLIQEAENAGGEIDYILDSTAESIYQIEKLKKERKNAVSSLVVQGYIIFLIFVGIMLIMQFKILPLTAGIGSVSLSALTNPSAMASSADMTSQPVDTEAMARPFLYLLLVQGFFAGLTIGKISEGSLKYGIKHSIILTLLALLIASGSNVIF